MIRHHALCFIPYLIPALSLATLLSTAACTQIPELDATVPDRLRNAPYPDLITLDGSLATAQLPRDQADEIEQSLAARRSRLQARARDLDTDVVDPQARKRMQGGVSR